METQDDFRELLEFHGAQRYTGDLDILVKPDHDNTQAILMALHEFGFASVGLTVEDFILLEMIVHPDYTPVRIDFITPISGVKPEPAGPRLFAAVSVCGRENTGAGSSTANCICFSSGFGASIDIRYRRDARGR